MRVTQKHIDEGEQVEPGGCAIALALKDRFGIAKSVFVNTTGIEMEGGGLVPSYNWRKLPKAITSFIRGFDVSKHKAKPFSFKMKVPVEYTKK